MNDTPETDKITKSLLYENADKRDYELRQHARKLERERDEAIAALKNYKAQSIHTCHDQCQQPMCLLRRERDEARALADRLGNALEKIPWTFTGREEQASEEWNALTAWKEARSE